MSVVVEGRLISKIYIYTFTGHRAVSYITYNFLSGLQGSPNSVIEGEIW